MHELRRQLSKQGTVRSDVVRPSQALRQPQRVHRCAAALGMGPAEPPARRARKPEWVRILEEDADVDEDVAKLLSGADGDPDTIRARMKKELLRKDLYNENAGSSRPPRIAFRQVDPFNLWVWFEFAHGSPSKRDVDMLQALLQSWFTLGKMGGFNSQNMQVFYNAGDDQSFFDYDNEAVEESQGSLLHDMSELEVRGDWARCRIDIGSCDELALDALLNSVVGFSKDVSALSRIMVGGQNKDWELPDELEDQDNEDYRFDIDPMQLPEGLDEELELLDALESKGVLRRRPGEKGAQGEGTGADGEESGGVLDSLGDMLSPRDDGDEEGNEEGEGLTRSGRQKRGEGGQQGGSRQWGDSFMRKYSEDEFKKAFRSNK